MTGSQRRRRGAGRREQQPTRRSRAVGTARVSARRRRPQRRDPTRSEHHRDPRPDRGPPPSCAQRRSAAAELPSDSSVDRRTHPRALGGDDGDEPGGDGDEVRRRTRRGGRRRSRPAAAPGATPATSPVCMIAMPSVSRPAGTVCSVSDMRGDQRRGDAKPPRSRARHISGKPRRSTGGTIATDIANAPHRTRTAGPRRQVTAPVTMPGEQAAQRPRARAASPARPVARARRRTRPWSPPPPRTGRRAPGRPTRERQHGPPRHRRPCARRRGAAAAGGSVARWAREREVPTTPGDHGDREPGDRVPRGGQHGRPATGPTMKTASSSDRLERVGRLHVVRAGRARATSGPARTRRPGAAKAPARAAKT